MKNLKWGIIAPGGIANKFASDMKLVTGNDLIAVASRSKERAASFAQTYSIPNVYGDYESILEDDEVDIVYIATPHTFHAEWAVKALNAGKHVLCEKPMGINTLEVQKIIEASIANNCFLMEAIWSRFNPTIQACLKHVANHDIGEPNYLTADFTFYNNPPEDGRLLNMDLAGGSLLDIGIYPLFLSYMVFGIPKEIKAIGRFHKTGADTQIAVSMLYDNAIAQLGSSIISDSKMEAKIAGKKGAIYIDTRWHEAQGYTIVNNEGKKRVELPSIGRGYSHEILECQLCINNGQIESHLWSHQNSLDLVGIMDEIRNEIGLKYPFE